MRNALPTAAALMALAAAPAFAQESSGSLLPSTVPGITAMASAQVADVGSQAYPDVSARPGSNLAVAAGGQLPGNGSEASVQTVNLLPSGFEVGTAAYAYARLTNRNFAAQAERNRVTYTARAFATPSRY